MASKPRYARLRCHSAPARAAGAPAFLPARRTPTPRTAGWAAPLPGRSQRRRLRADARVAGSGGGGGGAGRLRRRAARAHRPAKPPSGTFDVRGHGMFIECKGEGSPTVVLDSGLGVDNTSTWAAVRPQVARFARVCIYDRAGMAQRARPGPRTIERRAATAGTAGLGGLLGGQRRPVVALGQVRRAAQVDDGVQLGAEQQHEVGDPDPDEQDHHARERAVGRLVGAEVRRRRRRTPATRAATPARRTSRPGEIQRKRRIRTLGAAK